MGQCYSHIIDQCLNNSVCNVCVPARVSTFQAPNYTFHFFNGDRFEHNIILHSIDNSLEDFNGLEIDKFYVISDFFSFFIKEVCVFVSDYLS